MFRAQPPFLRPRAIYTLRVVQKAIEAVYRDGMAIRCVPNRLERVTCGSSPTRRWFACGVVPSPLVITGKDTLVLPRGSLQANEIRLVRVKRMTLIVTHISRFGIIHSSDSNLSSGGAGAGHGQKTFRLPHMHAGTSVAGAYSVRGTSMDIWMKNFIHDQRVAGTRSIAVFANALRDALEAEMDPSEKRMGSMCHVGGYVRESAGWHPEFHFVRNIYAINQKTGEYEDFRQQFQATEDFWSRDCPRSNLMAAFQNGAFQIYLNGFASGRIGYLALQQLMNDFFSTIWQQPDWKFRPPTSLEESILFVKLYITIIDTLFRVSDYSAPFIGGRSQICAIRQPSGTVTSC
jgi:hypothetical protein